MVLPSIIREKFQRNNSKSDQYAFGATLTLIFTSLSSLGMNIVGRVVVKKITLFRFFINILAIFYNFFHDMIFGRKISSNSCRRPQKFRVSVVKSSWERGLKPRFRFFYIFLINFDSSLSPGTNFLRKLCSLCIFDM